MTIAIALLAGGGNAEVSSEACELLSDPEIWMQMSGALERKLTLQCQGPSEQPATAQVGADVPPPLATAPTDGGTDILVNDPAMDVYGSTQSETTIVGVDDVVCGAWNDSGASQGLSGFGFSLDGGASFSDGGDFPNGPSDSNYGDPSLAYSLLDHTFYYASLSSRGLSLWASTDDCQSFSYLGPIHVGYGDDKELMAVDNNPSSPFFGRIYVGWTNFNISYDRNQVTYSDDGGLTWSSAVSLPGSGTHGQGMWPAVAPNGDVYFALANLSTSTGGFQDQWIYKSTNGGLSWTKMTNIASAQLRPENITASSRCGRQALNGDIRNLSSPQIAIHADPKAPAGYVIHAVYPYDADGSGPDSSDVFYKRSVDGALSWSLEIRLNDDATTTDQWFPAVGVNEKGVVAVSWYDRRLDASNLYFDRYAALSSDGGQSFGENLRLSDVSSPVSQNNPHFDGLATCYHGDYDQLSIDTRKVHVLWSDDRRITTGPNPDIYYDQFVATPAIDIDASDEFATNLFGSAASAIANPLPFALPISADDPLVGRVTEFEVVFTLNTGKLLDPLPSVGAAGSGSDIEPGTALTGGPGGDWTIELIQGAAGQSTLVLALRPPQSPSPVEEGSLLSVAAGAFAVDQLGALTTPGAQLSIEARFQEPQGGDPILSVDVLLATAVLGVEVQGEDRRVDALGELDSTGTRTLFRSNPIAIGVAGSCFGFPDGGGLFGSANCVEDRFQLDPPNDLVRVTVSADTLDPFLATSGSSILVVGGTDCELDPVLASVSGPLPPGQTFAELTFEPSAEIGQSLSVCLFQEGLAMVPAQLISVRVAVEFSSVFLLDASPTVVGIEVVERCFGDFNGDFRVNNLDALYFRGCFPCAGPPCDRACDADLNDVVNNFDALQFRRNFGTQCPSP